MLTFAGMKTFVRVAAVSYSYSRSSQMPPQSQKLLKLTRVEAYKYRDSRRENQIVQVSIVDSFSGCQIVVPVFRHLNLSVCLLMWSTPLLDLLISKWSG